MIGIATFIASGMILCFALWAALSQNVRDWFGLKLALGCTAISAYVVMAYPTARSFDFLIISIAAVCACSVFQQRVLRRRLFHRDGEKSGQRHSQRQPERNARAA